MEYSIFALELAARTHAGDPLRSGLRRIVLEQGESADRAAKRDGLVRAARLLSQHVDRIELGCWDYFDDHHRAVTDFAMWSDGMLGEEGVRAEPADDIGQRYLTFTMAFLIARGSATDRRLAKRCEIDDDALWRRDVFVRMLDAIEVIDFGDVRADVVYLIPGRDDYALTERDFARGKLDHLRRIE